MMRGLKSKSSIAFLALCTGISVLIWLAIIQPIVNWRANLLAELVTTRDEEARIKTSIRELEGERISLTTGASEGLVWSAAQAGEATAKVQAQVSELARRFGVSIKAISPLSQRDVSTTDIVGFRLEFEAPLDRLTDYLVALEFHAPALAVNRGTMRVLNRPGPAPAQPILFVQLDIFAPVTLLQGLDKT